MNSTLSLVIVDDMQFSRLLISRMLKQGHYSDIRCCADATEALQQLQQRAADVVLVDWEMPGMNGLEFTHTVRAAEDKSNWYTAIIMITANQEARFLEEAFLGGVDDFIYKPFKASELLARIYSAARIGRQQNSLLAQTTNLLSSHHQQQQLVTHDPLTLLFNRRQLRVQLEAVLDQTYTRGGTACLCLIELTNLSNINENQGYQAGDETLIVLAKQIRRSLRPMDFISRYWGGIFAVLIYSQEARIDFDKLLRRLISEAGDSLNTSLGRIGIQCSAGAQVYQPHAAQLGANEIELMALAHLNRAKMTGSGVYVEIKKGTA